MQVAAVYPELKTAYQELQVLSLDEENRELYEQRLKWYMDEVNIREGSFEQGIQQGISQGAYQAKLETAQMLLQSNKLSKQEVAVFTGLSLEEIENIASS